jgi:hypothetical protein
MKPTLVLLSTQQRLEGREGKGSEAVFIVLL